MTKIIHSFKVFTSQSFIMIINFSEAKSFIAIQCVKVTKPYLLNL